MDLAALFVTLIALSLPPLVVAPVGETVALSPPKGQRVQSVWVSRDGVVGVGGNMEVRLTGKVPDVVRLTITGHLGAKRDYLVVVPKPR